MPILSVGKTSSTRAGVTLLELTVVVALIGLLAAVSFPSVSTGLDSVRLATTSGSVAGFLNSAVNRAERLQQPIQVEIVPSENRLTMTSDVAGFNRELKLPEGITLEAVLTGNPETDQDPQQGPFRLILLPGAAVPGIGIQFANRHGGRRIVRLDPMTGYPRVESVEAK